MKTINALILVFAIALGVAGCAPILEFLGSIGIGEDGTPIPPTPIPPIDRGE